MSGWLGVSPEEWEHALREKQRLDAEAKLKTEREDDMIEKLNKDGREITFEHDLPTVRYLVDTLGVYWMSDWNRAEEMRELGYLVRLPDDSYAVKRQEVEF